MDDRTSRSDRSFSIVGWHGNAIEIECNQLHRLPCRNLQEDKMKKILSRKGKVSVVLVIGIVVLLAGTALALSNIFFMTATVASYDFGGYGPGYPVPGTIQIQGFRMNPGDTVPWHYHKGVSYVILAHGTLTETHVVGPHQCASEEVPAGSAFVESPGQVHSVTNTGTDVAVIWWATVYPKSDGPRGIYLADAPSCN